MQKQANLITILHNSAQAKSAIFEYIEVFYDKIRQHSTIGYCSPSDYEKKFYQDNTPL
jgi:transposase InsO family protein